MIDVAGHIRRRRGHVLVPRGHFVQGGGQTQPKMRRTISARSLGGAGDTTNKDQYDTGSLTLFAGEEMFLGIVQTATAANGPSSFGGTFPGTFTLVNTVAVAAIRVSVYRCFTPVTISGNVLINFATGDVTSGCAWRATATLGAEPSGANGSAAVQQSQAASGSAGTTVTMTLASALENLGNMMLVFMMHAANEDLLTYGTGFTRYGNPDSKYGTPGTGLACCAALGLTSLAPTWTTSSIPRWVILEARAGMA